MQILQKLKNTLWPRPYFFVLGAGRGGTSLLAGLLDYHPKLTVGFERFAFDDLLGENLMESEKNDVEKRISHFKNDCQNEANRHTTYWGNKITTEQIAALGDCQSATWPVYFQRFARDVLTEKKVVFILRDGRTCIESKIRRTGQPYDLAVTRWKTCVHMLTYLQQQHKQLHVLRYEDLLENPEAELTKVCAFLNIVFTTDMLAGTANPIVPEIYRGDGLRKAEKAHFPMQWTDDMRAELIATGYLTTP